jgi:hypothetical protein
LGDWYIDRNGEWQYDEDAPAPSPEPTQMQPIVSRETRSEVEIPRAGDIGDWIDPNAPDPSPPEVTDPQDPSFVHPWFGDR